MFVPSETILHIDDNEANRYIVRRILQNAGFAVVEAATGTAGLEALALHQPALIILDVQLPDLNGFEVCRQIKANPRTRFIPVLHLSASFVKSQDKAEGLDSGADGYLAQPVEPIELLATVRSLFRIRQAEELALISAREWQTTFDAINDSVCLLDQQGKILRCNQAMTRLFDKPAEEILGQSHYELMNASLGVGDGTCFYRARETYQRQLLELQSQERWFAKTMDPVLNEFGSFTGAVLILVDITNRKQIEDERKQAEITLQERNQRLDSLYETTREQADQLRQANRIKDEFLAVLSHELRSPLNPILGWARILQTKQQNAAKTQYALETIERNARLQAQLIEDLLDVSRILQGKLSLNTVPVNLPFTIKSALETVQLAAEAKSIQIETIFDPDVGQVLGDSSRIQQILWNLISNAVKFTPQGGSVKVRLEQIEEVEEHVSPHHLVTYAQITVSDTGKGITASFLPYVFDYFRQADSTTTRSFGGLGLGLAIVSHLVDLHGGTVQAASLGEGQGSTFIVRLPIIAVSKLHPDHPSTRNSSELHFNGLRVLFADDERDSRELVTFLLEQQGAKVTQVESAREALDQLQQAEFDLLISDIGMPDMDGYDLIRHIRERSPDQTRDILAVAITAYAGESNQQKVLAAGFQQHITKPIEPETLLKTIWTLVQKEG
ncbi:MULTISPECIES: response regulator [Cyanophyceae]|uniref:hybrid sensor histidine kinase/response regulator n=1 Tax=Cyanophyceae TaxID=3028117 RepID=UPI0016881DA3|nr:MULTISPECIES: response regulator [Cyanophyceae]MBD1918096.1 response regulator [Phormidium sp. FACHB-77]MBD2030128.1 response regulator [Phormidium sp. FACHB-322]MBD2051500.1 response regulator [Leptolyngbya sp. FACHB-60]